MKKHALNLMGLLSIALAVALLAPQLAAADDDDPPGRVARLSYTHGAVSFEPAGTDDWVSAVVNRPMTTGDKLWSDNGSRAELHIGSAAIRLDGNTGFSFLNLTDNMVQLRVTEGTLNIRVRRLGDDETFEVDTPNLAFTILRPGTYRINVNEAGDTTVVTVRDGQGEVTGGGSAYTIHPREVATFNGIDQISADVEGYGGDGDDFDSWCNERDRRMDHSSSARYVSNDVIGYEDLDEYGGWRPVPEYGNVWFPHVTVVGWAPYRYGHWCWISPWGWTWVEDEPWGFAPFHYGRWVAVNGYWGWVPCPPRTVVVGVVYVRPVYAPALVAWVGGPHFSVGIGIGGGGGVGVAWFPLGPREVFVPSYRVSRTYVNNVNVSNTTVNNTYVTNVYNTTIVNKNVTNIRYVNQNVNGSVTATSHETFTSARPVGRNMIRVDQREIASAQVSTTATPAVAPQRQALLGAGARANVRQRGDFENRAVVARTAPPPPPASFDRQEAAIKANGGRPIAISEARQLQPENARPVSQIRMAPPARTTMPENNRGDNRPDLQKSNSIDQPGPPQSGNRSREQNNPGQPGNVQPNQGNQPNNVGQPGAAQQGQGNRSNNSPPAGNQRVNNNDRPSSSRLPNAGGTNTDVNPQLEQRHQQELENVRRKQDQERQKVEQQQYQEQQKLQQRGADERRQQEIQQKQQQQTQTQERQKVEQQKNQEQQRNQQRAVDERRQQESQQRQQQQLQNLERKHDQEQQRVQERQQQEHQRPPKESKPPKEEKEKDKPPHGRS